MTEMAQIPKLDVMEARAAVVGFIQARGLAQSVVAREIGISGAAVSQFLASKYQGDNEAMAGKLLAWMETTSRRDSMPAIFAKEHGFVRTAAAGKILAALSAAQALSDMVMVYGEPGVGKTAALEHYRRTGSSVWLSVMSPDTAGKVPMLEELGFAMGLALSGGAASMRRAIVARARNTNGLIIVDEAQHLDGKALDEIRSVYDRAVCGLVLCGNPLLKEKVAMLPQVNSRVGRKTRLGRPTREDVARLAAQYSVEEREKVEFLSTIAQHPGGLRCVVKVLRLAAIAAEGDEAAVAVKHLAAAWAELALEDRA